MITPASLRLGAAVLLLPGLSLASPPWTFEELVRRADRVFLAHVESTSGREVDLAATRWPRGHGEDHLHFSLVSDSSPLPPDCLVISQRDAQTPPASDLRLGQGIEGQAGYRGWIAFPIEQKGGKLLVQDLLRVDGTRFHTDPLPLDRVLALMKAAPYRP